CGLGAIVYQYPRRSVCKSGTSMKIECHSVGVQATTVVWYRQSPQRTFELMAISTLKIHSPCHVAPHIQGSMDTEVIQNPRYLVKEKEQKAKMDCTPMKGHSYVYWYYKKPGEELKFLVYFQNTDIIDKTDVIDKRSLDGQVIQTPQHLFKGKGQKAKMNCSPESGHTFVYWYQQKQNRELKFLISFQRQEVRERTDLAKERFLAECPLKSPCSLEIQSSESGDSALYLCASSLSTALKGVFSLLHKPSVEPTQEAGSLDAKVTQTPRYLVKEKGQKANMTCIPEKGHTAFYWYHQNEKGELKLLINFRNEEIIEQTDLVKKRFSAECPSKLPCSLEIQSSETGDSALYLCASSQYTVLKCAFLSVHKPHCGQTSGSG
ncbi:hypothetical protein STEG23_035748, partial [Scotinomys teguina]